MDERESGSNVSARLDGGVRPRAENGPLEGDRTVARSNVEDRSQPRPCGYVSSAVLKEIRYPGTASVRVPNGNRRKVQLAIQGRRCMTLAGETFRATRSSRMEPTRVLLKSSRVIRRLGGSLALRTWRSRGHQVANGWSGGGHRRPEFNRCAKVRSRADGRRRSDLSGPAASTLHASRGG